MISPTWRVLSQGDFAMDRPGTLFFEFAEAQAGSGSSPGDRRYNWEQKQASLCCCPKAMDRKRIFDNAEANNTVHNLVLPPLLYSAA